MKKQILPVLACFLLAMVSFAQTQLGNPFYNALENRPCPYDEDVTVQWPVDWEIYQTLNGEWDGPVDSSRCITVAEGGFNPTIDLGQVDPGLPLFIRSTNIIDPFLLPDHIYLAASGVQPNTGSILKLGTDCPGGLCSGLITRINIPAAIDGERSDRTYKASIDGNNQEYYIESCITSERFEDQFAEEFVVKFTFNTMDLAGHELRLFNSIIDQAYSDVIPFSELVFPDWSFTGSSYDAAIGEIIQNPGWSLNFLGAYADTTYPSILTPFFIEARPEINTSTAQQLNLMTGYYGNIQFQPFTQIRGALVEGSDSVRHELNIINDGMDWCLGVIIDLVFNGSANLVYGGGHLDFGGETACLMFLEGSELKVKPGVTLHYGTNGDGLLGLGKEGRIVLGKDSRMVINNRMVLWNHEPGEENQTSIDLQPGNHLVFGPTSRLERVGVQDHGIKLDVYMNGGTLDDSGLSPEDRMLINRIYPPVGPGLADNLIVFPNPVSSSLNWSYTTEAEGMVRWTLSNTLGQIIQTGIEQASRGKNIFTTPCSILPPGTYYLEVDNQKEYTTIPIMKN